MKEIVLKFKNNGITYFVYKENNKYIPAKLVDKKITNLTDEEYEMVNFIFDKMLIKKVITLNDINLNNKVIKHYYDKENKIHGFLNEDKASLTKEELSYLNNIYNNQLLVVYYNMNNNSNSNFINKIVKYGKKTLVVLIASNIMLTSGCSLSRNLLTEEEVDIDTITELEDIVEISDNQNKEEAEIVVLEEEVVETREEVNLEETIIEHEDLIKEYKPNETPIQETSDEIEETVEEAIEEPTSEIELESEINDEHSSIQRLIEIINSNDNIPAREKEFFINNLEVERDNVDYIDWEEVYDSYERLTIEYDSSLDVGGSYNIYTKEMKVKGDVDTVGIGKVAILHEKGHILEKEEHNFSDIGTFEPLESIFNQEYYGEKYKDEQFRDSGYKENYNYIYALTEIVGSYVIRNYHFNQDREYLVDEMNKIWPDRAGCYSLLDLLTSNCNYDKANQMNDRKTIGYVISDLIRTLYEIKYNEDITNNIQMMAYLYPERLANMIDYSDEYEEADRTIEIVNQKAYFNHNSSMYMQPSTYRLVRTVYNYKDYMSLEDAIKNNLVILEDGKYISDNSNVTVEEDGSIYFTVPSASVYHEIEDMKSEINRNYSR